MRQSMHHRPPKRVQVAAALAAGSLLLGAVASVHADVKASRKCRDTVSKELGKLAQTGFKNADKCHKTYDKVCTAEGDRSLCNTVTTPEFDPKSKYAGSKTKATEKTDKKCLAGDPVLDNFTGADPDGTLFPIVDDTVQGNSNIVQGDDDLVCDKLKVKCLQTAAKGRTGIVKAIVKESTKCQKAIDKVATIFGEIDASCVDPVIAGEKVQKAVTKANEGITKKCADESLTGADVGSCDPLPSCAVDSSITVAKNLVKDLYRSVLAPGTCGDGVLNTGEQCDDSNLTDGDGCNSACELENNTCSPIIGTRTVQVSIDTPQPLAGVQIDIDYPQFQAGIRGFGPSGVVQSHFTVEQGAFSGLATLNDRDTDAAAFFADASADIVTGLLFTVDMDNCKNLSENICNRNQDLAGCVIPTVDCGSNPPLTAGCCPNDNQCVPQTQSHGCTVSSPVDEFGQPVAGVTCSVVITES